MRFLVLPENSYLAVARATFELNKEFWSPVLEEARGSGGLRPDLDLDDILIWLGQVQFMVATRAEHLPTRKSELRTFLRQFVLPALIPDHLLENRPSGSTAKVLTDRTS